jgi:glycosyltransferase involved in cell wall biosynthesis
VTPLFCSTIIPTIGRPSLNRAVESVLSAIGSTDDCELIVVNDSGHPLPAAAWQQSDKAQIIATNRHNRSVARNCGAAVANGRYFHFLDDDDWLEPGALAAWRELATHSQAGWLYGGFRLVDNSGAALAEIQLTLAGNCFVQVMASEWIPLQASLIDAHAFFNVGGFAPLPSLLGGYEDIDLLRLIAHHYTLAGTHEIVANIRSGDQSSTTDYANMINQNRQSREKLLAAPGTLVRLRQSAATKDRAYWHGRIVYYYLASTRWNLRRRHLFTAIGRALHAVTAAALTGPHLLSHPFWRALTTPHHNQVRQLIEQRGLTLYQNTNWID